MGLGFLSDCRCSWWLECLRSSQSYQIFCSNCSSDQDTKPKILNAAQVEDLFKFKQVWDARSVSNQAAYYMDEGFISYHQSSPITSQLLHILLLKLASPAILRISSMDYTSRGIGELDK